MANLHKVNFLCIFGARKVTVMGFFGAGRSAVSLSAVTLLFKTKRFKVRGNNS
jgi:hypothetical protein